MIIIVCGEVYSLIWTKQCKYKTEAAAKPTENTYFFQIGVNWNTMNYSILQRRSVFVMLSFAWSSFARLTWSRNIDVIKYCTLKRYATLFTIFDYTN